jgi:hypothetical protein
VQVRLLCYLSARGRARWRPVNMTRTTAQLTVVRRCHSIEHTDAAQTAPLVFASV